MSSERDKIRVERDDEAVEVFIGWWWILAAVAIVGAAAFVIARAAA